MDDMGPSRILPLPNPADLQRDQPKPNRKAKPRPQQKQAEDHLNDSGEELSEQEKHQFDTLA